MKHWLFRLTFGRELPVHQLSLVSSWLTAGLGMCRLLKSCEQTSSSKYIHTHTHTDIHRDTHTYRHTQRHTHIDTHRDIHTDTYTYRHTHRDTHRHTQTQIQTHTETHIQTHTHTHIHTHTLLVLLLWRPLANREVNWATTEKPSLPDSSGKWLFPPLCSSPSP